MEQVEGWSIWKDGAYGGMEQVEGWSMWWVGACGGLEHVEGWSMLMDGACGGMKQVERWSMWRDGMCGGMEMGMDGGIEAREIEQNEPLALDTSHAEDHSKPSDQPQRRRSDCLMF